MAVKTGLNQTIQKKPKKTSIGHSNNTSFSSKNDKRNKKAYRGQGK